MNFDLLKAIKSNGLTQRKFAKQVRDHESIVSRIINGVWNIDEKRKSRYAKILNKKPKEIFK